LIFFKDLKENLNIYEKAKDGIGEKKDSKQVDMPSGDKELKMKKYDMTN